MKQVVRINSDAEFAAYCAAPNTQTTRLEFGISRINLPPLGLVLRHHNAVEIAGETAPSGRLLMTGGRFSVIGCEDIEINRVGFRSQRRDFPLPAGVFPTYERSHKGLVIHAEKPDRPCRNITLTECSVSGHTDEIEVGPADHASWFAQHIDRPAAIGVVFDRLMFGPSFMNTGHLIADDQQRADFLRLRQHHNFGISAVCCDGLTFNGCVFSSNNRRSPLVQGKRIQIAHCVLDDFGTMGVGLHAGTDAEIIACHFVRGPHTKPFERPISLVEGTFATAFASRGPVRLAITKNCWEYDSRFNRLRQGWECWQEAPSEHWVKMILASPVQTLKKIMPIVNSAGCGDSLDRAIRSQFGLRNHIPWVEDYGGRFRFPIDS